MTFSVFRPIVLASMLMVGLSAFTQISSSKSKEGDDAKGFSEIESIQATVNSDERLFKLDSTIGWDFNKHFGVFAGVPVSFLHHHDRHNHYHHSQLNQQRDRQCVPWYCLPRP